MQFDRNGNGRLGWIEAEAWRMALRKRLLQAHDADENGRLEGPERVKALAALGPAPPAAKDPQAGAPGTSRSRGAWIRPYDTDGDGTLSQAEADAAAARLKEVWQRQMLERFDTDGDGQLSQAERKARREYWRNRDRGQRKQWMLRYFDDDGDGEISQAERENLKALGQSWKQFGQEMKQLAMDTDGDGTVGKIEQAAVAAAWMAEGSRFLLKTQHWSDADGDGQVSWAEREAFQGRVREAMVQWFDKFAAGYDRDGDGRFTQAQRREVVKGLQTELRNRIARADVNSDGVISPTEGFDWIEAFGREIGAIPSGQESADNEQSPGQIE
jgi:Ca2+-binding EF-hand superfamily protein